MKIRWQFILLAPFAASCWVGCQQEVEKPTLPDTMIARIMADLFVAEAATNGLNGYAKDSLTHVYYDQVFKIHATNKEVYEKNVQIIAQDEMHIGAVVDSAVALLKSVQTNGK